MRVEALIGAAIDWTELKLFLPPLETGADPRLARSALASSFVAALELAKQGKKRIAVMAPAFSADCIETLEEINGEIRESFEHAGGESFTYIPCLNDDSAHIGALVQVIEQNLSGWL